MLLISYEFLVFLSLLTVLYYMVPKSLQCWLLLAAGIFFYGCAGWKVMIFLLAAAISTWYFGCRIGRLHEESALYITNGLSGEMKKAYRSEVRKKQWRLLLTGLIIIFGMLGLLKYTDFMLENANALLHLFGSERSFGMMRWMLPLGISYYTFQAAGYLIDVYRKKYPAEQNLGYLALFISFFPQLIQGPISRYDELKDDLFGPHDLDWHRISFAVQRMLWGYFKKLVVADRLAMVVLTISQDTVTWNGSYIWLGMICYTVQIYADFSGGIDIVIGAAGLFGIRLPENFDRPYFSATVAEYWQRWHISLMRWLREYVFYPACVCGPINRLGRWCKIHIGKEAAKRIPLYSATVLVWLIVGVWHGATWGYVAWGMINCCILLISRELEPLQRLFHQVFSVKDKLWFRIFQVLRTLLLLSMVQMLEYYKTLQTTLKMQWNMFTASSLSQFSGGSWRALGLSGAEWIVVFAGIAVMILADLFQCKGSVREQLVKHPYWQRIIFWYVLFASVLIFGAYGQGYDAARFVYNQF